MNSLKKISNWGISVPVHRFFSHLKKGNGMKEIERKWLVGPKSLPEKLGAYSHKEFAVGYFEVEDGKDVRIRREGSEYYKVKKSGRGLVREVGSGDIEITKKEFFSLWPKTKGRRLWKRRYYIPLGGLVIELDMYYDFKGLYTVEIEFKTVGSANKFTPLEWFGREVTNDSRYSSNSLATNGLPKRRSRVRR